jgi:uncharacterized protein (TIGR04141 family)
MSPRRDKRGPDGRNKPQKPAGTAPRRSGAESPKRAKGAEKRSSEELPGATYYRLRGELDGKTVESPDVFLTEPDLLIGEAEIDVGTAFLYGRSPISDPPEFIPFLRRRFDLEIPDTHKHQYVLVVRTNTEPKSWYALAFGGRHLLKDEYLDVDGAREIARRQTMMQKPGVGARLNQLRTKEPGLTNTITTEKRANRPATLDEFDFDPHTSVLDAASGTPQDSAKFGSRLTGSTGIVVRKRVRIDDLARVAADLETAYKDAVEHGTIIGMRIVHNQALISQLDLELVALLKDENETDKIAFSLPYFEDTEDNPSLSFTKMGQQVGLYPDDLDIQGYRSALKDCGKWDAVSVEFVKASAAIVGDKRRFKIYQCLSAVVELGGKTYVHDERSWYSVPSEAKEYIDEMISGIPLWEGLPDSTQRVEEKDYNTRVGVGEYLLLDRRTLAVIAGEDPIEICDLLTMEEKKLSFIHVKRDFSSSTLSHLFAQGRVSASLLQQREPRGQMLAHIRRELRRRHPQPQWSRRLRGFLEQNFQCNRIRIIYAIAGDWGDADAAERIPFFSKVNLIKEVRNLRGRDFDVRLARIQMPGPVYVTRKKKRKPKAGA